LESFNDKRIKIFYHDKRGVKVPFLLHSESADDFYFAARNFENALKKASGDYIFLSDQDDVWLADKVEKVLPYLKEDNLVISDAWIVNSSLKQIDKLSKHRIYKKGFLTNIYIRGGAPQGCVCAFTKRIKDFILPIPKNVLTHDFWIGLLSELKFSSVYIPEQLVLYRRHASTISHTEKSLHSFLYIIIYRGFMFCECLKRYIFRR
jgi:hypothetical protein